jgi:hypothetical protein
MAMESCKEAEEKFFVKRTSELLHALYTAISIKVVHEQSGKVEYERERLLGIALKIH